LNRGPADYESAALPTELPRRVLPIYHSRGESPKDEKELRFAANCRIKSYK
jgi:hypothetical protein